MHFSSWSDSSAKDLLVGAVAEGVCTCIFVILQSSMSSVDLDWLCSSAALPSLCVDFSASHHTVSTVSSSEAFSQMGELCIRKQCRGIGTPPEHSPMFLKFTGQTLNMQDLPRVTGRCAFQSRKPGPPFRSKELTTLPMPGWLGGAARASQNGADQSGCPEIHSR